MKLSYIVLLKDELHVHEYQHWSTLVQHPKFTVKEAVLWEHGKADTYADRNENIVIPIGKENMLDRIKTGDLSEMLFVM
jgi:hypothetical protein